MNLSNCFMDLIAFVSYSLGDETIPVASYDQFRADVIRLVEKSHSICSQFGLDEQEYADARFAVLTWVDECVMKSAWKGKAAWRKELLQRVYYKTTDGGVRFFNNLEDLHGDQNEVREVYYMCLVLGFSGKFGDTSEAQAELDNLKARCLNKLAGSKELFSDLQRMVPESYQNQAVGQDRAVAGWGLSVGAWLTISLPVVLFVFLLIVYGVILNGEISSNFAEL